MIMPFFLSFIHKLKQYPHLDNNASKIITGKPSIPEDYDTEFLDYILAIKIVENILEKKFETFKN